MHTNIDTINPHTGRILKEDSTAVNFAESFDPTGGVYVNDEVQHAIHGGNAFSFSADGTIPATSSLYFMWTTGDKQIHFMTFSGDFQKGGIRLSFYEAPTTTANGTLQTSVNMNFNSVNASTMALYSDPTITTNGTLKGQRFLPITGGGANVSPVGGDIAGGRILKANTKYLFRIENTDNSTCSFGVGFVWYDSNILLGA